MRSYSRSGEYVFITMFRELAFYSSVAASFAMAAALAEAAT